MSYHRHAFTLLEMVVVLAIISLISVATIYSFTGMRQANRDAKRVADISEIQAALEQYYLSYKFYPLAITSGMSLHMTRGLASDAVFMAKVPNNPLPSNDGTCPSASSTYSYLPKNVSQSYELSFCLGGRVGTWGAGVNIASPGNNTTCVPDCSMSCDTGSENSGSDGCGGICSNKVATCATGFTCLYDHCVKD